MPIIRAEIIKTIDKREMEAQQKRNKERKEQGEQKL